MKCIIWSKFCRHLFPGQYEFYHCWWIITAPVCKNERERCGFQATNPPINYGTCCENLTCKISGLFGGIGRCRAGKLFCTIKKFLIDVLKYQIFQVWHILFCFDFRNLVRLRYHNCSNRTAHYNRCSNLTSDYYSTTRYCEKTSCLYQRPI